MENLGKRSAAEMNGGDDAVRHSSNGEAMVGPSKTKKFARFSGTAANTKVGLIFSPLYRRVQFLVLLTYEHLCLCFDANHVSGLCSTLVSTTFSHFRFVIDRISTQPYNNELPC